MAFFFVSEKKKMATNFLDLATTLENLGGRCLLEKSLFHALHCFLWLSPSFILLCLLGTLQSNQ